MKIKQIINITFYLIFGLFIIGFLCYLWNILMPTSLCWLTENDLLNFKEHLGSIMFMLICSIISYVLYNKGDF